MDKLNAKELQYRIVGIELLSSTLKRFNGPTKKMEFRYETNIQHSADIEKKLYFVITTINIFTPMEVDGKMEMEMIGEAAVSCIYEFPNMENFCNKEEKTVSLPYKFCQQLNSISLSTTRGVLYSQFKGTVLNNAILPIIDIDKLVEVKDEQ